MLAFLIAHESLILMILLAVSEVLAVIFPADSGFGGIVAGAVKLLKSVGAKEPGQQ